MKNIPQEDGVPKRLPIGLQTFENLIEYQYLYVDKTPLIYELIKGLPRYFLSRPRRFGKSLLISTLECVFKGQKELFRGLAIAKTDYSWEVYPVIRLDMSTLGSDDVSTLCNDLSRQLHKMAEANNIRLNPINAPRNLLDDYISALYHKTGKKVVVLIDEYDSPLVNKLHNPDLVSVLRETLREFYRVTKSMDKYLQFVFITGVTNFAKSNMFSGLNHLNNITMDTKYHEICGYTQKELESNFASYIIQLMKKSNKDKIETLALIKKWYNGYQFTVNSHTLYNPFSILLLFDNYSFKNYWYQTGTPGFLVRLIQDTAFPQPPEFDHLKAMRSDFDTLSVEKPSSIALLFQAGYLTIKRCVDELAEVYELGYPNHEVKQSFLNSLLTCYSNDKMASSEVYKLAEKIKQNNIPDFFQTMQVFFSQIPYEIHISKESYHQTVFYLILRLLGYFIQVEVHTNTGRIDAVIELPTIIYIVEFKLNATAEVALKQIEEKEYAAPYMQKAKQVILIGIAFDMEERNIKEWKMKKVV